MSAPLSEMVECANHCGRWLLVAVGHVPKGAVCAKCAALVKP